MALICDLLESSITIQQQLIQNKGFLVISYLLEKVCIHVLQVFQRSTHATILALQQGPAFDLLI